MKIIVLNVGSKKPSAAKVLKEIVKHTGITNLFKTNVEYVECEKKVV